ncbi:LacI family DNA-binding transcriptional regulator [Shimia sp. R9_3]|uniref:LacI family DNA-binding transcriptional regulator n=1 Tax=Shimia sp. R9_3 TaxID=2821113 RepID=UPI001ADA9A51|nr:LacI family DNA-binding transcriptional regulator [Shimia sp. R9_3]MBO9400085.1 LacI family DNA-binding transcriptional regulator [Shimia sp. R9_3]
MERRPTIKDVAREAGVSKSTVSLVLQGSSLVKSETREHVQKVMADIGYVYNRAAAKLRSGSTGLIGLVINDLRNPFFSELAASLQRSLSQQDYAAVVANTEEDPALQQKMINALIEHGVSAFVICPTYDDTGQALEPIARAGLPAMQVFRRVDNRLDKFPFAAPDYAEGGRLATEHLLSQGAKQIAFVGGLDGRPVTQERVSGYLKVMEERDQQSVVLTGAATRQFGREQAQVLKERFPEVDGVICFNDLVALGLVASASAQGRVIGAELRVVGVDNIEECAHSAPPLSSVSCRIPEFATHISDALLGWLTQGPAPAPDARTPVSLMVRASSGES